MSKTIFIICSVRGATREYKEKLEQHAAYLELQGYKVHLPHRNTKQDQQGIDICRDNMWAIIAADEVHVFYTPDSRGTHFDLGVAFALRKPIIVVESSESPGVGKSFARMIREWEQLNPQERKLPRGFIIEADDWVGLYVDGKCVYQGHDFNDGRMDIASHLEKYGLKRSEVFQTWIGDNDDYNSSFSGEFEWDFNKLADKEKYITDYERSK